MKPTNLQRFAFKSKPKDSLKILLRNTFNAKVQNDYAILYFQKPYRVWFLIHRSVVILLWIGIKNLLGFQGSKFSIAAPTTRKSLSFLSVDMASLASGVSNCISA